MKYIKEFRDGDMARAIAARICEEAKPETQYRFMEFCGGHTHAIHRYGVPSLLPKNVDMVHGPGCPVCILAISRLDQAIHLSTLSNVILCTYGDMIRVPASNGMSLIKAKATGADVRMVYSVDDAIKVAKENPAKKVIFFAIGFETTTPPTAAAIKQAEALGLKNFFVFCNHVLTPPALGGILTLQNMLPESHTLLNGIVGPAHVSVVIGSDAYKEVSEKYHVPIVIAGFEPLDVLQTILLLIRQVNEGRATVDNQYTRAVTEKGNTIAQALVNEVFELRDIFEWRGLGEIPDSALKIRAKYAQFDVEQQPDLFVRNKGPEQNNCRCGEVLCGFRKPNECPFFGTACTPETPMGACMVSAEGACAAYYAYGRLADDKN